MMTTVLDAPVEPDANLLTVETTTKHVTGTATRVLVGARQHEFTIDEPAGLGGDDVGANPVEHLLAALGSCQVITYRVWAEKLGLTLDTIEIDLAGQIDLRGFLGLDEQVRPGFGGVELVVRITGPDSTEDYERLVAAVAKHCPVEDNLANGVPVTGWVTANTTQLFG